MAVPHLPPCYRIDIEGVTEATMVQGEEEDVWLMD